MIKFVTIVIFGLQQGVQSKLVILKMI